MVLIDLNASLEGSRIHSELEVVSVKSCVTSK